MPTGRDRSQDSSSLSVTEAAGARQQLCLLLGSTSHREATTLQPWVPDLPPPVPCSPGWGPLLVVPTSAPR